MKRLLIPVFALLTLVGCSTVSPDAGHEAVLVYKPWLIGSGGVDPTPVHTGLTYTALTTTGVDVSLLPQRVDMEFDDMMTSSGVPVNFHVVLGFKVTDSVKLVSKFGADRDEKTGDWGFFNRNLDQPIRTAVRDSVKKRDMQEMAISQTAADQVGSEVQAATLNILTQLGVPIQLTSLNVGRVNPPDAIKHQRIDTATQEQRIITEQQRKLAEDQRKMAEESRAAADNAYNQQMHLTPEQYIQLEQMKVWRDVCAGGKCTFITNGTLPLVKQLQ